MDKEVIDQPIPADISLRELLRDLWRAPIITASAVVLCSLAGVGASWLIGTKYEARITIMPVSNDDSSGRLGNLGQLASQYSGLASLAGISLPGQDKRQEDLAVLQSELLTQKYIQDNDLLPVLYSKLWDPQTRTWRTRDPKEMPTLWKAYRYFQSSVSSVVDDKRTGMVILTVRWKDPILAAKWANGLVTLTNAYLRDKAIREAERNIAYLNSQVAKTNVVEAQRAIYSLLQEEINKEMIARGRDEYALQVIDPAFVPERPATHGWRMFAAIGFCAGWILALAWAFGRRVLQM